MSGTVSIATMYQASLPGLDPVVEAVATQARAGVEKGGAVSTRREVVEFILGWGGYSVDAPPHEKRLPEPSFGHGDFLLVPLEWLLEATRPNRAAKARSANDLRNCIRAVELHTDSFRATRDQLASCLVRHGMSGWEAEVLLDDWLIQGDFRPEPLPFTLTHVVGNPPYSIKREVVPSRVMAYLDDDFGSWGEWISPGPLTPSLSREVKESGSRLSVAARAQKAPGAVGGRPLGLVGSGG